MAVQSNYNDWEKTIRERIKGLDPRSPGFKAVLFRIGSMLVTETKKAIVRQGVVDTGRLLNSITFMIENYPNAIVLKIGSVGIPYAAMHEFGGIMRPDMMRAMFASLSSRGLLSRNRDKNVITKGIMRSRPYLRPTIAANRQRILRELQDFVKGATR